jgi:L-threonylcarbamoyladenylate synthase
MISIDIDLAADCLKSNGVIGFPTETVYGLAANAFSEEAIKKVFEVKKRPTFNPLIVHIKSILELDKVAIEIPEKAYRLAAIFWPGPLTLILKKKSTISNLVTANQDTVAVRVPKHPLALELLNQLDFPLVAPSANPYTRISPTTAIHVENYFANQIDMVLDGGTCTSGIESTIIGFDNDTVILYRLGALAKEEIEKVVGEVILHDKKQQKTITPGMHFKHYAPKTTFILSKDIESTISLFKSKKVGALLFNKPTTSIELENQFVLSRKGDLVQAAANLYRAMHHLDKCDLDVIIAEYFPKYGLGSSINDRLERASKS